MRCKNHLPQRRRGERGQTLIFGLLAMVVLAVAIFILFDLQSTIHYKIKAQTATDAAALVGAKWQKESLNLIGELNLVKACNVLITDTKYGVLRSGETPENFLASGKTTDEINADKKQLEEASLMLAQMQARVSFVGPLVGLGAAQQAAKNNGLNFSDRYSDFAKLHYQSVCDSSLYGASVLTQYIPSNVVDGVNLGYLWRLWSSDSGDSGDGGPYGSMLRELLQVDSSGTSNQCTGYVLNPNKKFAGQPSLYFINSDGSSSSDTSKKSLASYLASKGTYDAILANNWCSLKDLVYLDVDYAGLTLKRDSASFPNQSEYLPLQVTYFTGSTPYNKEAIDYAISKESDPSRFTPIYDPKKEGKSLFLDTVDPSSSSDKDSKYTPFPYITWCVYDTSTDVTVDDVAWGKWDATNLYVRDENQVYLRSKVKEGYDYKSGAFTFMGAAFPAENLWISGNWSMSSDATQSPYLGDNLKFGGKGGIGSAANKYADQLKSSESSLRGYKDYSSSLGASSFNQVFSATSVAKPLGKIKDEKGKYLSPLVTSMILPVFDNVSLIPMFLPDFAYSNQAPPQTDPFDDFYYFLLYYMPELGATDNLSAMPAYMQANYPELWGRIYRYHLALVYLSDSTWRQGGIDWLNAAATYTIDANGNKIVDKTNSDYCRNWYNNGPGNRYGPSVLH